MIGTLLSIATFVLLYALILILEPGSAAIDPYRLAAALIIPLLISTIIGFGSGVVGSAALAGWLSVLAMIAVTIPTLWLIAGLPLSHSAIFTAAGTAFNVSVQSIWFYWLVKRA